MSATIPISYITHTHTHTHTRTHTHTHTQMHTPTQTHQLNDTQRSTHLHTPTETIWSLQMPVIGRKTFTTARLTCTSWPFCHPALAELSPVLWWGMWWVSGQKKKKKKKEKKKAKQITIIISHHQYPLVSNMAYRARRAGTRTFPSFCIGCCLFICFWLLMFTDPYSDWSILLRVVFGLLLCPHRSPKQWCLW